MVGIDVWLLVSLCVRWVYVGRNLQTTKVSNVYDDVLSRFMFALSHALELK